MTVSTFGSAAAAAGPAATAARAAAASPRPRMRLRMGVLPLLRAAPWVRGRSIRIISVTQRDIPGALGNHPFGRSAAGARGLCPR
ncbi:hypothetical protein GCM10009759_15580 [Kitasatospora saccharophila]|uniref:Uncharacterized protein n=1 Tax=Kitasatospora saccharophila TaxID=407973 RepID=A0ABP5I4C7_9ACTN